VKLLFFQNVFWLYTYSEHSEDIDFKSSKSKSSNASFGMKYRMIKVSLRHCTLA